MELLSPPGDQVLVEACARAAHEAIRAYEHARKESRPSLPWEYAPVALRAALRHVVPAVLRGTTPRELHAQMVEHLRAHGWTWGTVRDVARREHPFILGWEELPPESRAKDLLAARVMRATAAALGYPVDHADPEAAEPGAGA